MMRLVSLLSLAMLAFAAQEPPKAKPEKQDPKKKPPKEEEAKQDQPHSWSGFNKGAWAKYQSSTKHDTGVQTKEFTLRLLEVSERGCQVSFDDKQVQSMIDVPADHKALPAETGEDLTFKDKGTESVKCGTKSFKCNVKEYVRKSPALTETLVIYTSDAAPEFIVKKVQIIKGEGLDSKTTFAITKVTDKVKLAGQEFVCHVVETVETIGKTESIVEEWRSPKVPGHVVRRHSYVKGADPQSTGGGSDVLDELVEFGFEGP